MTYLSWAAYYEGSSDKDYFDVLLPRVMEELTRTEGTRPVTIPPTPAMHLGRSGRDVEAVAQEACENEEAFHILFIHADHGGRGLEAGLDSRGAAYCRAMHKLCGREPARCVIVSPRHEMEAWALSDPEAVTEALGYKKPPSNLGLPSNAAEAERLTDPKAVLDAAVRLVQGRRSRRGGTSLLPAIAQRQSISVLRGMQSFKLFESGLRTCLSSLGCLGRHS